jgi:hypothetical protein
VDHSSVRRAPHQGQVHRLGSRAQVGDSLVICPYRKGNIKSMAKTVEYEGYPIQSAPHHPVDNERWQLRIFISLDDHRGGGSVRPATREFSADVLYAIEQEADIHGITFAQRLIERKVEGLSVMDMKSTDRRATPRLRCKFAPRFRRPRSWKERAFKPRSISESACPVNGAYVLRRR